MKFALPWIAGFLLSLSRWRWEPFPASGANPFLDLIELNDPALFHLIVGWYYLAPWAAAGVGGALLLSMWQIWFAGLGNGSGGRGSLPRWPSSSNDKSISLVVGETHHPTRPVESEQPDWLVLSEKGLFTGVAVVGAVGTGKTSACMQPFAEQLFSWQSHDSHKKAAGLVLEVKGDFCYAIRDVLDKHGRGDDYLEIGLNSHWQWNPLDAHWMDSYSLAYTIASLMNQLFGRGKEPFWQQASTNLVRNIIELYRVTTGWVTLQDVYNCAIDPELLGNKIEKAYSEAAPPPPPEARIFVPQWAFTAHGRKLKDWEWKDEPDKEKSAVVDADLVATLTKLSIDHRTVEPPAANTAGKSPRLERIEAVKRWYHLDWMKIDLKLRTSIVEGISVFLGLFDTPEVARMFCPPEPEREPETMSPANGAAAGATQIATLRPLPSLSSLIEEGKVICLNMPVSSNAALARAIGVMLKQSWLGALLLRPADMRKLPTKYFRPAVFLCDEYQSFATVGEADPSGDEKAFGLSRQSRCIPIVATQSISSLRSVTGSGEAWRTLFQNLRTKVFLSLSDDSSARIASEMCGQVEVLKTAYSFNESTPKAGISLFSGAPGGGKSSLGVSKSFQDRMEPLFRPKAFAELDTGQAIVLPYDGKKNLSARRCYLKPFYLPRDLSYWRQQEKGMI
ncbi:MAG: TraM recognition domain-containing protein [Bryobacterales bacterium]|nr:TraM recognition domain-containing protein [Bryobacterales bacterium]MDE0296120.1 TraM recognition domain-containing protein [Bryobacterales bacterium]